MQPSIHQLIFSKDGNFSFIIDNGCVYSFGKNDYGQLGLGDDYQKQTPTLIKTVAGVIDVSLGYIHSMILIHTGQVYTCGNNKYGQLGLGDNFHTNIPTLIQDIDNVIAISANF